MWTTKDPLWPDELPFVYGRSNLTTASDPTGLDSGPCCCKLSNFFATMSMPILGSIQDPKTHKILPYVYQTIEIMMNATISQPVNKPGCSIQWWEKSSTQISINSIPINKWSLQPKPPLVFKKMLPSKCPGSSSPVMTDVPGFVPYKNQPLTSTTCIHIIFGYGCSQQYQPFDFWQKVTWNGKGNQHLSQVIAGSSGTGPADVAKYCSIGKPKWPA
jgi:hypothetical protein